LNTYFSRFLKM